MTIPLGVDGARVGGLRLDEVLHLRWDKINLLGPFVEVKGKGGRGRAVKMLDPDVLTRLPQGSKFVFSPTASFRRTVQRRVREACEELGLACKGTHGFRATFAERLLEDYLGIGLAEREARKAVSTALGHNRVAVTLRYVPK